VIDERYVQQLENEVLRLRDTIHKVANGIVCLDIPCEEGELKALLRIIDASLATSRELLSDRPTPPDSAEEA